MFSPRVCVFIYVQARSRLSTHCTACDLLSEKTPSTASRKLPSTPSAPRPLGDASGASGFSQSALRRSDSLFLTLPSIGADREQRTEQCTVFSTRGRVEDEREKEREREGGGMEAMKSARVRVTAAEEEIRVRCGTNES